VHFHRGRELRERIAKDRLSIRGGNLPWLPIRPKGPARKTPPSKGRASVSSAVPKLHVETYVTREEVPRIFCLAILTCPEGFDLVPRPVASVSQFWESEPRPLTLVRRSLALQQILSSPSSATFETPRTQFAPITGVTAESRDLEPAGQLSCRLLKRMNFTNS
jgi:hypothetical protein